MNQLFIAIARLLHGSGWQAGLAGDLGVADRTIRRWAAGSEPIPPGVWNDLTNRLYDRWVDIGRMRERLAGLLGHGDLKLEPIPNALPQDELEGIYFFMRRPDGNNIRCWAKRSIFDDLGFEGKRREALRWFMECSDSFHRAADTKFQLREYDERAGIFLESADVIVSRNLRW
jgi:hypothetical protein